VTQSGQRVQTIEMKSSASFHQALQKIMAWAVFAFAGAGLGPQDGHYGTHNCPDRLR
jgi:hypothetical protein